jgi:hypothetical protein
MPFDYGVEPIKKLGDMSGCGSGAGNGIEEHVFGSAFTHGYLGFFSQRFYGYYPTGYGFTYGPDLRVDEFGTGTDCGFVK